MSTAKVIAFAPKSEHKSAAAEHYEELYTVSRETVHFAESISIGGIVTAGLLVIAAMLAYQMAHQAGTGFPVLACGLVVAAIIAVVISRVWETLLSVQGRLLETMVDTAVNTSPFLSSEERLTVTRTTTTPLGDSKS